MPTPKQRAPAARGGKYRPAHGREFDITALDAYKTSRTRDNIAYIVVGAVVGALIAAGIYGIKQQNFGALNTVWTVAGPLTGAIIGYYFHRGRKD